MEKREYGSGSIYFSESRNKWVIQCKVGINANGKPKKTTRYAKTKKEAKEILKKLQAEVLTGAYKESSNLTIVDIATSIVENKKAANVITPTTYKRNTETIRLISSSNLNTIPIQKVTEIHISNFLNSLTNYSNSVIKKVYMMIGASYKLAIKMQLVTVNLMDYILRPKSKKQTRKVRALTIDEQKMLIEALNKDAKEPYRTMLFLSLFTGMRMGEISALPYKSSYIKWKIINIERTITKNGKDQYILGKTTKTYAGKRTIKINEPIVHLLENYIKTNYRPNEYGLLFVSNDGSIISTNQVNSYYKRLVERYHIAPVKECNQHQLRHTFATRCIESGMPAKVLQHILGHKEISTTLDTYTDVFDSFENTYTDITQAYLNKNNIAI